MIKLQMNGDNHHLSAAIGWIGLGDWCGANEELEKIAPACWTPSGKTSPTHPALSCRKSGRNAEENGRDYRPRE
jgi:hypothetical protein